MTGVQTCALPICLVDDYAISALDVAAYLDWYKVLNNASDKALEAEGKRAAKPSL